MRPERLQDQQPGSALAKMQLSPTETAQSRVYAVRLGLTVDQMIAGLYKGLPDADKEKSGPVFQALRNGYLSGYARYEFDAIDVFMQAQSRHILAVSVEYRERESTIEEALREKRKFDELDDRGAGFALGEQLGKELAAKMLSQ